MSLDNYSEMQLHDLISKRQALIIKKKELANEISYIKAKLLLPEHNNEFNKKQLLMKQKEYQQVLSSLDNISNRFKLLCTKLRIVRINLKQDNYLKENLNEDIDNINCYGCVETGEVFEGPKVLDNEVPTTNLDRFELTAKTYKKIMSSKK